MDEEQNEKREKRPRTAKLKSQGIKVEDGLEYKSNKCTAHGRYIENIPQTLLIELWHDKHYVGRYSIGDENGPREGIEAEFIRPLIEISLKHLLFYSSIISRFSFVNDLELGAINRPASRVILQDSREGETLNVTIEVHFIDFLKYEVTVITAMRTDDFNIRDGQYILEIRGDDDSTLKWKVRGKIEELSSRQT